MTPMPSVLFLFCGSAIFPQAMVEDLSESRYAICLILDRW